MLSSTVVALAALGTPTGCAAPPADEDDVGTSGGESALTVANGAAYISAVSDDSVTVHKQVAGVPLKFAAADFAGKSILVHPIDKKSDSGVFAKVVSVEDKDTTLVIHTHPLELEEMENTRGDQVIRLFRDPTLTVAPTTPEEDGFFPQEVGTNSILPNGFAPAVQTGGIHTAAFSGPLATGDLSPDFWVGNAKVYGGGQIHTNVTEASLKFTPKAILNYQRGKGLTVGIKGDFAADLAIHAAGYAEGHVVFYESPTLKSPRVTFVVPMGIPPFLIPVPVSLGVDTYVECSTLGAVEFDGTFRAHLGLSASASAVLKPSLSRPLKEWVGPGPWQNRVRAEASFGMTRDSKLTGAGGVACAAPRIEFPIRIAGLAGPFLAIHPEYAAKTDGFETTVDLYAGASAEGGSEKFFELLLLRWVPGKEK